MIAAVIEKIKYLFYQRPWLAYLFIILAAVIVYGQTIFFDYSYLDDQQLIIDHADILTRVNPGEIFFNDVFFSSSKYYYRPLLTWSFVLDWHWGGEMVFAFHFSNIIFHALAACLLLYLLRLIHIRRETSFWLALLFAIHPALTQAVSWIPGRNDSLVAIFIFSTLIFLSRWFRSERLFDLVSLWLFFLLALFTKETAALIPFFALGWILVFERPYFSWFKLALSAAGATVAGIIWYLARLAAIGNGGGDYIWQSLVHNLLSPVIFIGKAFFPFNLSVYPVLADSTWFYGIMALLLLAVLLLVSRPWRWQRLVFGLTWFWLLLVLGSARPDSDSFQNFMEHRLYVPMLGLLIILSETENFWRRLPLKWRQRLLTGLLALFLILSVVHNNNFKDRSSFWRQAAKSSPHSPLAQRNLGAMYYLSGDLDKAEPLFRKALSLNEQEPMAHNNLAAIYIDRGDYWRAESELKKELAINPYYDVALFNLGRVYYERRRYQEAAQLWQETLRLNPRHQEAAFRLNELLLQIKNKNIK